MEPHNARLGDGGALGRPTQKASINVATWRESRLRLHAQHVARVANRPDAAGQQPAVGVAKALLPHRRRWCASRFSRGRAGVLGECRVSVARECWPSSFFLCRAPPRLSHHIQAMSAATPPPAQPRYSSPPAPRALATAPDGVVGAAGLRAAAAVGDYKVGWCTRRIPVGRPVGRRPSRRVARAACAGRAKSAVGAHGDMGGACGAAGRELRP